MAVTAQWLFHNYTMIENYTFLRNESQPLKFLYFRQLVVSAKCLFGEKSVRQTVRSTKCSFDKVSVDKMPRSAKCPFGKMTFRKVSFGKMSGYRNRSCVTQLLSVFHTIRGRGDLDGRLWAKHWTPLDAQNLEGKENY